VASLAHVAGAVTLVEGQTFCVSGRTGDISPDLPQGLFVLDTRVLSSWQLRVNGYRVEPLTVDVPDPFCATFVARVHPPPLRSDSDVVVFRERSIGQGMCERLSITNYGPSECPVIVELQCDVDFADLFAVKESRVKPKGTTDWEVHKYGLRFHHHNGTIPKHVEVAAGRCADIDLPSMTDGVLTWTMTLAPRQTREICVQITVTFDDEPLIPRFTCEGSEYEPLPLQRLESWRATMPVVDTDHEGFDRAVTRAGEDLGALRIFDPDHPEVPILAAGAPWFMTVFGRDSLITGWMTLLADYRLAIGVLETLARFQGNDVRAETEEEPGKILHEMRFGAAARPSLSSGQVYYGSVDATPLFVMLLGELRRWGLADDAVDRLLPHADRALAWIEEFGDADGDGYVEYARRSERGLVNQGWKDSWDAIRWSSGALAKGPIALCEVQGYVYSAYLARAYFADEAGDAATAARFRQKAHDLYVRFNEDFWLDEHGWYALALDGDKRPVDALASNMGHCLWTGIVDPERAGEVAKRLLSSEMFSGWGVRTLGSNMAAYNPVSYHNGSVWPHDNAIVASGLMRYGFVEEAHEIIRAQLEVAALMGDRLPELFAGFPRGRPATPAAYPTSCSPQAWASAAPLLWLRTLLRFDPWVPHGEIYVEPALPDWMRRLRVDSIELGGTSFTVEADASGFRWWGEGQFAVNAARPPLTATLPSRAGSPPGRGSGRRDTSSTDA